MSAWDKAKELSDKHASQGGIYVRLQKDGDKVAGAFCGEPLAREVIWTGSRYEPFDPNNRAHRNSDKKPSLRVSMNFYVPAEGAMKIIEGSGQWFRDLLKLREKYGLDTCLFEVERHGGANDPKTSYSILPDEKLSPELRARIQATELHDLAQPSQDTKAAPSRTGSAPASVGELIDPRTSSELVARLKGLPAEALQGFLTRFGIRRVSELKAADLDAARSFLDDLAAGDREAGQAGEIDPFT